MNNIDLFVAIPLDPNYNDTFSFPNGDATIQYKYFTNNYNYTNVSGVSWVRPHKNIKINKKYNDMLQYNYLSYENDGGKRFYAFILEKNYINANTTELVIEIDYMQTYYFDYMLDNSFIEREHQDRFDKNYNRLFNIKTEALDYGDGYVGEGGRVLIDEAIYWYIVISEKPLHTEQQLGDWGNAPSTHYISMIPNPNSIFNVKYGKVGATNWDAYTLKEFYDEYRGDNSILAVYPIPYTPADLNIVFNYDDDTYYVDKTNIDNAITFKVLESNKVITTIEGHWGADYRPRELTFNNAPHKDVLKVDTFNKNSKIDIMRESKLFTYPYRYMMLTDNMVNPVVLRYENQMNKNDLKIKYIQELGMTGKYGLEVLQQNQNKYETILINNQDRAMPLITDAWKDYVKSGRASSISGLAVNATSTALGAGGAIAMGMMMTNPITAVVGAGIAIGGLISVGGQVANHLAKEHDIKSIPDSFANAGNNSLYEMARNNTSQYGTVHLYMLKIKKEYEKQVYDYLSSYGYISKEIKKPNLYSRYRFNYIKTVGARVIPVENGAVNADATTMLTKIYDSGITLHHVRPKTIPFKDYDKENIEISLMEDDDL